MSGWKGPELSLTDLEHDAFELYQMVWDAAQCESGALAVKYFELTIKAVRLRLELRKESLTPRQLDDLGQKIDDLKRTIHRDRAGTTDGAEAPADRPGEPPPWTQ